MVFDPSHKDRQLGAPHIINALSPNQEAGAQDLGGRVRSNLVYRLDGCYDAAKNVTDRGA